MDDCSWLLFHGDHADGKDSERSYGSGQHDEHHVPISTQVQQQLKQLYMLMDTEEDEHAATVPTSSSRSMSGSPDETTSLMLTGRSTPTTDSYHQSVEVSSLQMPLAPIAYGEHHDGLCLDNLDTILNLDNLMYQEQAGRRKGHEFRGAFRPYARHLNPTKKPKPGACGQRVIKAAMSALERMHTARLAHWQSCQMTMAPPPSVGSSNCNQLQHVLSERKRREKLNDSFKALKAVLPPGSKKDKASTLMGARDYVNTLKSRVSQLEEKNRMLIESELRGGNGSTQGDHPGGQIEVDITNKAAEKQKETSKEIRLKIVVGSGGDAMDAVVTTLQCLKEIGDVRLMAMDTGSSSTSNGLPLEKDFQIATVTLQVKESVIKIVKDAMKSGTIVTTDDLSFDDCSVEMYVAMNFVDILGESNY